MIERQTCRHEIVFGPYVCVRVGCSKNTATLQPNPCLVYYSVVCSTCTSYSHLRHCYILHTWGSALCAPLSSYQNQATFAFNLPSSVAHVATPTATTSPQTQLNRYTGKRSMLFLFALIWRRCSQLACIPWPWKRFESCHTLPLGTVYIHKLSRRILAVRVHSNLRYFSVTDVSVCMKRRAFWNSVVLTNAEFVPILAFRISCFYSLAFEECHNIKQIYFDRIHWHSHWMSKWKFLFVSASNVHQLFKEFDTCPRCMQYIPFEKMQHWSLFIICTQLNTTCRGWEHFMYMRRDRVTATTADKNQRCSQIWSGSFHWFPWPLFGYAGAWARSYLAPTRKHIWAMRSKPLGLAEDWKQIQCLSIHDECHRQDKNCTHSYPSYSIFIAAHILGKYAEFRLSLAYHKCVLFS